MNAGKLLAIGAALAVVLAVSMSLWLDPPSENRARTVDTERLRRLELVASAINAHFDRHQALPSNIDELDAKKERLRHINWLDPNTGQPFEYEIIGEKSYRLCANFERASDRRTAYYLRDHNAGRDCFEYKLK